MSSSMCNVISLLEQCVLYSQADYNPFSSSSSTKPVYAEPDADNKPEHKEKDCGEQNMSECVTTSSLLNVDLDFHVPLKTGQFITHVTTPLAKSTNRRSGIWQKGHRCRSYSCCSLSRPRGAAKSKLVSGPSQHQLPERTSEHPPKADFLSLPGEVREMVYDHLFCHARIYLSQKPSCKHAFNLPLSIRRSCKIAHSETDRALFRNLEIYLIVHGTRRTERRQINDLIPNYFLTKLQNLTLVAPAYASIGSGYIVPKEIPSLQRLRLVDVETATFFWTTYEESIKRHESEANALITKAESTGSNSWFPALMQEENRGFKMEYEVELWTETHQERAAHMGNLPKVRYRQTLISCSEEREGKVVTTEMSTGEFRKRNEVYQWMEKSGVHISHRSHAVNVLRRLGFMQYHESLDRIEAGTANSAKTDLKDKVEQE